MDLQPEQIAEMKLDALLESYLAAQQASEELEASLSVLRGEMQQRLDAENLKGKVVGDYSITKVTRFNFKPTLEQARELAATKTVEQVDTQALKRLHNQGVEIPNTTTTTFVMVRPVEKPAE